MKAVDEECACITAESRLCIANSDKIAKRVRAVSDQLLVLRNTLKRCLDIHVCMKCEVHLLSDCGFLSGQ